MDLLPSSGLCFSVGVLERIGPFREDLFIDGVDTEWMLRCHVLGIPVYVVPEARLAHSIGERVVHLPWSRSKEIPIHKPFRYYYTYRNYLLLARVYFRVWRWLLNDFLRLTFLMLLLAALPGRGENLGMALRGLRDGLLGRSGPLETEGTSGAR